MTPQLEVEMPHWKQKRLPHHKSRAGLIFCLVMALAVLLSAAGLIVNASFHSRSQIRLREDTIAEVSSFFKRLSYEQSEALKQILAKWEERSSAERFWPTLIRDISIALGVAVFLTITIELYAGRRLRSQAAEDVLAGVFNKIIPEEIFEEIRDHVIGAEVMRRKWEIRMNLSRDPALSAKDNSLYLSTTVIGYAIENLLGRKYQYPVLAELSTDIVGVDIHGQALPRYARVTINEAKYEGSDLERYLHDGGFRLDLPVDLPSRTDQMLQVLIELQEIVRVPDAFNWATPMAADGAIIEINTTGTSDLLFKVEAYHPDQDRLVEQISGRRWVFSGGILPWQSFQILVSKKDQTPSLDIPGHNA